MVIIKESYAAYDNKVPEPPTDAHELGQEGLLEATATQWKNGMVNNMIQFFKMQLFRASLPGDLRKAMAQHDQNTIMLDDMYKVTTDTQRESRTKKTAQTLHRHHDQRALTLTPLQADPRHLQRQLRLR